MTNPKYLILAMFGEHDNLVAVVPLDENFQIKMELRLQRLETLHKEDDALDEFVFSVAGDAWPLEQVQDWIDDNDEDGLLEDRRWLLVDGNPSFDDDSRTRISVHELHLTRFGSYYWSFLPKHCDQTYESVSFDVKRNEIAREGE